MLLPCPRSSIAAAMQVQSVTTAVRVNTAEYGRPASPTLAPRRLRPYPDRGASAVGSRLLAQRRALLANVYAGRAGRSRRATRHPYLQRAAKYHAPRPTRRAQSAAKKRLTNVYYVYGDDLGHVSGQAKAPVELPALAAVHSEFQCLCG